MTKTDSGGPDGGNRGVIIFTIASAAIFLAIAGCVVYFVVKIVM